MDGLDNGYQAKKFPNPSMENTQTFALCLMTKPLLQSCGPICIHKNGQSILKNSNSSQRTNSYLQLQMNISIVSSVMKCHKG